MIITGSKDHVFTTYKGAIAFAGYAMDEGKVCKLTTRPGAVSAVQYVVTVFEVVE